jgi:hypothetical protein
MIPRSTLETFVLRISPDVDPLNPQADRAHRPETPDRPM